MVNDNKCPECNSKDIGIETYEEIGGPETVDVCQVCKCRFFHGDMIQVHGNTKLGIALTIAEYLTSGYINLDYLVTLRDRFKNAKR